MLDFYSLKMEKAVLLHVYFIMDIPIVPNQPETFKFPQRSFGVKIPVIRNFRASWFKERSWLHYD